MTLLQGVQQYTFSGHIFHFCEFILSMVADEVLTAVTYFIFVNRLIRTFLKLLLRKLSAAYGTEMGVT